MHDEEMERVTQELYERGRVPGPVQRAGQQFAPRPMRGVGMDLSTDVYGNRASASNDRMPGIIEADIRVHEGLNLLSDNLGELETRLRDVLRPGLEKSCAGGMAEPRPARAPLAERLATAADRVSVLAMQVRSILNSLEV